MNINLVEKLAQNKVFPIIRSSDPQDVICKAQALLDGGLDIMEINIESPKFLKRLKHYQKMLLFVLEV